MRRSLHDTGELIRFNGRNLLLFQMGYRLTAASAYVQLLNAGMRFSLKQAGYSYLTLENGGRVLLCPWTVPVVLALMGVGILLLAVEAAGLTAACWGAAHSFKMPAWQIFTEGLRGTKKQMRRKEFRLFAVAASDFFVMNIFSLYRTLTHVKPVNFVVAEMSGNPLLQGGTFLFVCVSALAAVPSYFVFHGCIIEQKTYADSKRNSIALLKGRAATVTARVMIPQLLVMVTALRAAVEEMADWAEIDVQETKDGVAVVCHDENVSRITGVNRNIKDMTYEEIKSLDAGLWFSKAYKGERIPSLKEVMEYAKGRLNLNIEIKYAGAESRLPQKVSRLVEEYEMEDQCVVTCANLEYLKQIKEENPQIRTGYIIPAAYGAYDRNDAIDIISIRSGFVSGKLVTLAHEAGKSIHAWTVNDKAELERMRVLAVDNVITDAPLLAREILYQQEGTESLLEYLRELLR